MLWEPSSMQTAAFPNPATPGSEVQTLIASIQQSFQLLKNQAEYYRQQAELCLQESQRLEITLSVLSRGFSGSATLLPQSSDAASSANSANGSSPNLANDIAGAAPLAEELTAPEPEATVAPTPQLTKRTRTINPKRTPKGEFDLRANLPARHGKIVSSAVVSVLNKNKAEKMSVNEIFEAIYGINFKPADYDDGLAVMRRYLVKNKSTWPWQSKQIDGEYFFSYHPEVAEPVDPAASEPVGAETSELSEPAETTEPTEAVEPSKTAAPAGEASKTSSKARRSSKAGAKTNSKTSAKTSKARKPRRTPVPSAAV